MFSYKISGGNSNATPATFAPKDITFYDYDGTIVTSWTLEELATKTALPDYPSHEGLTCQGWNWSLADLKTTNRKMNVGVMYITDDGKTRIYIRLEEGRTSPMLGVCPNGTVTVDWGDGTTPDTLTGTDTMKIKWTPNHAYAAPGQYVITLTVDGTMGFYGYVSNQYGTILRYSSGSDARNQVYKNSVQKIEIGSGVTNIGYYTFYGCYSLASITIPNGVTNIGPQAFYACYSLASITIPNSITGIGPQAFYGCSSLALITIPNSITGIEEFAFYGCSSLASITIPNGVTSIGGNTFQKCYSLASITIPNSITGIGSEAFYACYGIAFYDFSNHTSVPTLARTDAFTDISADCQIRVPGSLYDTWKAATNWSTYADYIVPIGNYVSSIPNTYGLINNSKTIEVPLINYSTPPKCSIKITSGNSITIANDLQITNKKISFSISMVRAGSSTIALNITGEGVTYERSFTITVYETLPKSTATVIAVDGAAYGFALNSSGYYESQNKGVNNSYALCRVNISNPLNKKLYFDCINSGESSYDYGLLGAINQELAKNNTADASVKQSFKGKSSTSVQTVEYDDATGNCFIDVKFIKDMSSNSGNDSLQFKVRIEETT